MILERSRDPVNHIGWGRGFENVALVRGCQNCGIVVGITRCQEPNDLLVVHRRWILRMG